MDDSKDDMRQEGSMVEEQNEGLGIDQEEAEASGDTKAKEVADKDDPYSVKKRLGMQAKRHQREMRQMQEQIAHMQAQMGQGRQDFQEQPTNPYTSPGQPNAPQGGEEERIQRAVRYALQAKDDEARRAKDAERHAHVQKQYQRLQNEFDKASDKYEDFDDVVRGDDAPFTPAIRDALLFVDNPADVAYKLGKDRNKLSKISDLHPLDQAREVNKLSFALMNGNTGNKSSSGSNSMMNSIKANPVNNSSAITDKTPSSVIRARMKAGTWK